MEDGQFKWMHEEAEGNYLATEQDFYALVQSEAAKNGADLFDFRNDWKMEETKEPSEDVDSETKTPETVTLETTTPETNTPNEEENSNGNNTNQNNTNKNNTSSTNNGSSVDKTSSATKTGDNNNVGLFFGMSLISMLGLAILSPKKKERGNGEK